MKFKIVENFEGEKAHCCACVVEFTEPPEGKEIAAIATVDAKLLWKFVRGIKRRHPTLFRSSAKKPEDVISIALMKAPSFEHDLTKCSVYLSVGDEFFGLAPRWQEGGSIPFAEPESEQKQFNEYLKGEVKSDALRDYHSFLVDTAEEYWSQAELRKNDTDRESKKMVMEFRQMYTHYQMVADDLLTYMNSI